MSGRNNSIEQIAASVSEIGCSGNDEKRTECDEMVDTENDQQASTIAEHEQKEVLSSVETGLTLVQRSQSWSTQSEASSGTNNAKTRRASAPAVMDTRPLKMSLRKGMFRKLFTIIRGLPTVRIIPESSDAIRIASSGSAADLQALFKSGAVSPTDRSEDGWTLLMV